MQIIDQESENAAPCVFRGEGGGAWGGLGYPGSP